MLTMATGNRVHAPKTRGFDCYETPRVAILSLLKVEPIPLTVVEPACGPGAIVNVLRQSGRAVVASDLVDYGLEDSQSGVDFLLERKAVGGVPALVTNPPFKLGDEFVAKALELYPEVYVLMRLAFLEGMRWAHPDQFKRARDKRRALNFGAHLARVHVFAPRLPMMHRRGWKPKKGEKKGGNSGMAFAWFVFMRDSRQISGPAKTEHIFWRDLIDESEWGIERPEPAQKAVPRPAWHGGDLFSMR